MLGSCNTGKKWPDGHGGRKGWDEFAQQLADELGVPVTSPVGFARFDRKRGLVGAPPGMHDPVRQGDPGQWKSFFPRGK